MINFNKGTYYIGDLCYVVNDDSWDKLLDDTDFFRTEEQKFKGLPIYSKGTAYGDGVYEDSEGRTYAVDSGCIGIMPIEAMDVTEEDIENLGNIVTFEEDFSVYAEDGIFTFGHITINTADDEEEDYECEEFDEEY